MIGEKITGATRVAGVVGAPVGHSLSPLIHNAWLRAAGIDGVYVPFSPSPSRFESLIDGCRGGALAGLNVTLPFKERALKIADLADTAARAAGAANLLVFHRSGAVEAHNTDGLGLLAAFAEQAPEWEPGDRPTVVLGAGGAARGAIAALVAAGSEVRVVNRTVDRAQALAAQFPRISAFGLNEAEMAFAGAGALVNAVSAGLDGGETWIPPLHALYSQAVVMDMVYTPIHTALLVAAHGRGLRIVDGLAMLIGQARPSFEAVFGLAPPEGVDVRSLALQALGRGP